MRSGAGAVGECGGLLGLRGTAGDCGGLWGIPRHDGVTACSDRLLGPPALPRFVVGVRIRTEPEHTADTVQCME